MKTPLDTRGGRANDGKSARLGKKQPDGTHGHRIAHLRGSCRATAADEHACGKAARDVHAAITPLWQSRNVGTAGWRHD